MVRGIRGVRDRGPRANDALFADDAAVADRDGPVVAVDSGARVDDGAAADGDRVGTVQERGLCDGGGRVDGEGGSAGGCGGGR